MGTTNASTKRAFHEMSLDEIERATEAGFAGGLGLQFTEVSGDRVCANWKLGPAIHQTHGIVHGGAYCTAVESLASIGASVWFGQTAVLSARTTTPTSSVRRPRECTSARLLRSTVGNLNSCGKLSSQTSKIR